MSMRWWNTPRLIALYAVLNAVLYSALLPLWEGFDEPFHFGYVQQLATGRGLVDLRSARLSKEAAASFPLAPASSTVKVNMPGAITYEEWFSAPPGYRARARQSLGEIPRSWRWTESEVPNYEAHHPPLAYAVLAIPEWIASAIPLAARVLLLRILAALAGSALLYAGASALWRELGLDDVYRNVALFCLFSSQMIWATLAHVANDWLALPLAVWALVFAVRCVARPSTRNIVLVSVMVSAGLLTKAYFLVLEPLIFSVCALCGGWRGLARHGAIVALCAAPWYIRNQVLYHTATAMREARAGFSPAVVLASAAHLDWLKTALDTARFALWTGNNSFRPFSTKTIDALLIVWAAGLLLWIASRRKPAEIVVAAYCVLWTLALAYAAALAHVATYGASSTPSPWYAQPLVAPLLALALLGAARRGRIGAFLATALALLFGYVLVATYVFRLIPLYAGFDGRGSLRSVAGLYWMHFTELTEKLGSAALGPPWILFSLTAVVVALAAAAEWRLIRQMLRATPSTPVLRHDSASL